MMKYIYIYYALGGALGQLAVEFNFLRWVAAAWLFFVLLTIVMIAHCAPIACMVSRIFRGFFFTAMVWGLFVWACRSIF